MADRQPNDAAKVRTWGPMDGSRAQTQRWITVFYHNVLHTRQSACSGVIFYVEYHDLVNVHTTAFDLDASVHLP